MIAKILADTDFLFGCGFFFIVASYALSLPSQQSPAIDLCRGLSVGLAMGAFALAIFAAGDGARRAR